MITKLIISKTHSNSISNLSQQNCNFVSNVSTTSSQFSYDFFPNKQFNMQICGVNWMVTKSFVSLSEELKGESVQMTNSSLICY